jgi:hypothetical protein
MDVENYSRSGVKRQIETIYRIISDADCTPISITISNIDHWRPLEQTQAQTAAKAVAPLATTCDN